MEHGKAAPCPSYLISKKLKLVYVIILECRFLFYTHMKPLPVIFLTLSCSYVNITSLRAREWSRYTKESKLEKPNSAQEEIERALMQ
jgi:hypothetical protein